MVMTNVATGEAVPIGGVNLGATGGTAVTGLTGLAQHNIPVHEDEEGGSSVSVKCKQPKLKSSMLARPSDNIKSVEKWPHYNLQYSYAAAPVTFDEMSFEQLVASELRTIENCTDVIEICGRIDLLFRISHLRIKGYVWEVLHAYYAAVVRAIEQHEKT